MTKAIHTVQEPKTFISPGLSDIVAQDYIEALRDSEARFRTIFEAATMGIALVDKDGRVVEGNPALQRMLGYSLEELVNQMFTVFVLPEDAAGARPFSGNWCKGNKNLIKRKKNISAKMAGRPGAA